MGLDCALFTLKDHANIISKIKDFMFDELDERFTFCFPQLVPTVKWKYGWWEKKKKNGKKVDVKKWLSWTLIDFFYFCIFLG